MKRQFDERPPLPGAGYMEDYTVPFLVSAGVLLFLFLAVLWALFGLPFALAVAYGCNRLLRR